MSLLSPRTTLQRRTACLVRTYAVSRSNPRPKDPVLKSPNANVQQIAPDVTFIHNPPSSVPTPHSTISSPASPFLSKPDYIQADSELPPELHPNKYKHKLGNRPQLTLSQINEMRQLRLSNPKENSCSVLARRFECSPIFVSMVAPLPKEVREEVQAMQERDEKKDWGERKILIREIRKRRREFW